MHSNIVAVAVSLALSASALGQAKVVITEIMYNPASTELKNETEWVEIANVGTEAIEIKDWHLDDEDKGTWGKFNCTLAPGGVAVLVNKSKMTEEAFRAAWDEPTEGSAAAETKTYQIIGVTWGGIANSPSDKNEILQLLNEKDEVVCEVKQGRDFPKMKGNEGCSVHLINVMAANLSDGKVWKKSVAGTDSARTCKKTELFDGDDVGSPGIIITTVPAMPILPAEESAAPSKGKKPAAPKEKPADAAPAPAPAATPAAPAAEPEKPKNDSGVPY